DAPAHRPVSASMRAPSRRSGARERFLPGLLELQRVTREGAPPRAAFCVQLESMSVRGSTMTYLRPLAAAFCAALTVASAPLFRLRPAVGYGALDVSAADTSHVSGYLFPLGMNVSVDDIRIDAPTRERVVGRLAALLDSFYVSPEVGKRMSDSLHARLKRGVYDRYTNGATLAIH